MTEDLKPGIGKMPRLQIEIDKPTRKAFMDKLKARNLTLRGVVMRWIRNFLKSK